MADTTSSTSSTSSTTSSTTTSGSSGSTTAASSGTGSPASSPGAGSGTTARRRKRLRATRSRARGEIGFAKTRDKILQRYVKFLAGLKKYEATAGFPNFFADTKFEANLGAFIDQLKAMGTARLDRQHATGVAAAARTQAGVVLDGGEAALIAFYGPTDPVLLDFGVPTAHPKARKRKAHPKAVGAGTASTSGGGGGLSGTSGPSGGTTSSPSAGAGGGTSAAGSSGGT